MDENRKFVDRIEINKVFWIISNLDLNNNKKKSDVYINNNIKPWIITEKLPWKFIQILIIVCSSKHSWGKNEARNIVNKKNKYKNEIRINKNAMK